MMSNVLHFWEENLGVEKESVVQLVNNTTKDTYIIISIILIINNFNIINNVLII